MFLNKKLAAFAVVLPLLAAGNVFASEPAQLKKQVVTQDIQTDKGPTEARKGTVDLKQNKLPEKGNFAMDKGDPGVIYPTPRQHCAHVHVHDDDGWHWEEFCD